MKRMTLFDLLENNSILIPALQRNYVHGRQDEHAREVRENFINTLRECYEDGKEMELGVVYGVRCKEPAGKNTLVLIDGQQRLTTLWLASVYAALYLKDKQERRVLLRKLSGFSYEGRPMASMFCHWLTNGAHNYDFEHELELAEIRWGEDSTVRAMIVTLRTMDKLTLRLLGEILEFKGGALLDAIQNKVHFEFSEVTGDSSDLYMKVNARGRTLTQWETFKGSFADALQPEARSNFNERIERLGDAYFETFNKIPDTSFYSLFGIIADYIRRNENAEEMNLASLATGKTETYVPVKEFKLSETANRMVEPLLRLMEWALNGHVRMMPFKYWDNAFSVADAVFNPDKDDKRDFILFLFEYFTKYDTANGLEQDDFRALRLVANVLENVTRMPADDGTAHFNRVKKLKAFIEAVPTLYADIELNNNDAEQYREECFKSHFYNRASDEQIWKLQDCECLMHGRVRIALLQSENGRWSNVEPEFEKQDQRLKLLDDVPDIPDNPEVPYVPEVNA